MPKLYPSNTTFYDLSGVLPVTCTWNGFTDHKGRLWVNPCFNQGEFRTIPFYQYDGTRSEMIYWDTVPEGAEGQAALKGMTARGEFFGMVRGTGHFFFFDPETRNSRFFQIDRENAFIYDMELSPTQGLLLFALAQDSHLVYRFREDSLELLLDFKLKGGRSRAWHPDYASFPIQALSGEELWFQADPQIYFEEHRFSKDFKLLCLNLRTGTLREFSVEDVFQGAPPIFPGSDLVPTVFASDAHGSVYLLIWDQFYKIDPSSGKANFQTAFHHPDEFLWDPSAIRSQKDVVGNLLFFFLLTNQQYYGVLVDTAGHYFDYSAVLNESVSVSGYSTDVGLQNLASSDFTKHFLGFLSKGVTAADLRFSGSISNYIQDYPARAIAEWRPGQYLVKTEKRLPLTLVRPSSIPAETLLDMPTREDKFFKMEDLSNLVKTDDGYWWFSSGRSLVRLDSNANYSAFPVGEYFTKFAFLDRQTIALALEDNQFYLYDLQTQRLQPWLEEGAPLSFHSDVHQILPVNDSILWVASLQGLWRINWKAGKSKRYGRSDGFADERFMCIHPGEKGTFWLGTYGGGLQFFDPESGSVQVIDQEKGLSNNTVIGILTDDDGDLWVSTYKGLNLVSPEGDVLAQFYQEDGLSNNEFNRFSSLKDSEGRLIFGAVTGINIIDPKALKSQLVQSGKLQIYLTGITYFDSGKKTDHTQYYGFDQSGPIRLPAAHRHLEIRFALSNLIRPGDQSFFFQIEKSGTPGKEEWNYLGNKPQLYLPNLSSGRYKILIKGRDFRGNWTVEPIVLEVQVSRFFYQTTWFYTLCFFVLGSAIFTWLYRQRVLRKNLEKELSQRTQEIMATRDQLIAQEKLASLGQLVAGIAHEIKNPINFMNNFSEGSGELLDELREELEQYRSHPNEKAYQLILSILEELKQNAIDITKNGDRADRIIRSMMDHARDTQGIIQEIDLNELVEDNVNLAYHGFRAQDPSFHAHFKKELDPSIGLVKGYPQDIGRVLLNILNNACFAVNKRRKDTPVGYVPTISVRTFVQAEEVCISIRDNGPGIPEAIREKIFLPFFTTKSTGEGNTGLGLSISYDIIVHQHQGKLEVKSEEGEYTEFVIQLPRK